MKKETNYSDKSFSYVKEEKRYDGYLPSPIQTKSLRLNGSSREPIGWISMLTVGPETVIKPKVKLKKEN